MKKYLLGLIAFVTLSVGAAGFVDYRSLNTHTPPDFTTNFPSAYFVGVNTQKFLSFQSIDMNYFKTNGYLLTLNTNSGAGGGLSNYVYEVININGTPVAAGTNLFAVTNGRVVTISFTDFTNSVKALTTNEINNTARIGPGIVDRVAKFVNPTNVTDSSIFNPSTNQIEFRQLNAPYASAMTNWLAISAYTNATGWRGTALTTDETGFLEIEQLLGSAVDPATFPRAGIRLNKAWLINGWGPTEIGDGGGKAPDLLPFGNDVHSIGSTSSRVKAITTGPGGINMTPTGVILSDGSMVTWGSVLAINQAGGSAANPSFAFSYSPYYFTICNGAIAASPGQDYNPETWLQRATAIGAGAWGSTNNTAGSTIRPPPQIYSGSGGSGADKQGGDAILAGSPSTGNATNGAARIQTAFKSGTGSSANTLRDRLYIWPDPINLTTNSATLVASFTLPTSLTCAGVKFSATSEVKSASDLASCRDEVSISAKNLAGTVTATNSSVTMSTISGTTATISTVYTVTVSSTTVSIFCNATTGGIQSTTSRLVGARIELDSDGVSVVNWGP